MSIQKKDVLKNHIVQSHRQDTQEYTHRICYVDITSPGYPGIYAHNRLCRYHIKTQEGGLKGVKIEISKLNMPSDKK